jgi:archaellin|tara:strand:- start:1818 stop:2513 length:696 start_codon:yes stop_codon:yes gene_type:complete
MATSNSKNFEPDVAEYIEEAFERCGLELRTGYDLKTANRSLNIMLAEWANRGLNQWTIAVKTVDMVSGTATYNVDSTNATAPIDVLDVFIRQTSGSETTDVPMTRLSRAEYSHVTTKTSTGKPNQFFVNKQITPTITVWPTPDLSSTYTIHMNVLTRMDDVDAATNTLEVPFRFYPCLAAGLAYYISMKKNPQMTAQLKAIYDEEFNRALSQDEDRASFKVSPNLRSYNSA